MSFALNAAELLFATFSTHGNTFLAFLSLVVLEGQVTRHAEYVRVVPQHGYHLVHESQSVCVSAYRELNALPEALPFVGGNPHTERVAR